MVFTGCADDVDTEPNDYLDEGEWHEQFVYEEWDLDESEVIEEGELYDGIFASLDVDDDGFLNEEEWLNSEFYAGTYGAEDFGNFNEWDVNNDGLLDGGEFEDAVEDVGLFDTWDINDDGLLQDNELSTGVFDSFDTDDDGLLDDEEFGVWEDYKPY